MDGQVERFINIFVKELEEENAALFAGAGLSVASGHVDWLHLLEPLAKELGLDVNKEHNLISVAQYHVNEHQRHALNQKLIQEFSGGHAINDNHRILARLPIRTFWTTNYDKLIEKSLEDAGRTPDVKYATPQLANTRPRRDAIVYKMHGDIDHPDQAVLTKDDYERYPIDRPAFITALSGDLVEKTFLFLGFSFTDPNLDYILSQIRIRLEKNQREHFCITKKRAKRIGETDEDHAYAVLQQNLAINDLKRFNVRTLLVDEYSDVTAILRTIEERFRRRTVLISGSAHEYGTFPGPEAFLTDLSATLVQTGHKIVSGFGLGVGSQVIVGALRQIYEKQGKQLQDQLLLRPFPQGKDAQKLWEEYRKDMVSYAGAAIFVFGNKADEKGNIVSANGVRSEFEIAHENGLKVIPIGATGFVAQELWNEVLDSFDKYYSENIKGLKENFAALGDSSLPAAKLIGTVLEILKLIGAG